MKIHRQTVYSIVFCVFYKSVVLFEICIHLHQLFWIKFKLDPVVFA